MAKILLAWEAGAFLGHEMLVTAASVLLKEAGHDVVILSPDGTVPNEAARRAGVRWATVPLAPGVPPLPSGVPWESRATTLWNFGFHSIDLIQDRFRAWDALLHREAPDVVVLQAAPFAHLAARAAGVPSVEFGIGFDVPPGLSPFPPYRNVDSFDEQVATRFERAILDRLRRVVGSIADRPLHAVVSGDRRLVVSIPELDHYDGVADPARTFLGPLPIIDLGATRPRWVRGEPRVLAYVRAPLVDASRLLKAIGALKGDAVVVCPGADEALVSLARKLGVRLHGAPVSILDLLPTADLVVSHGGGLMAEAVIRGRPCLALPAHFEQFMTATTLRRRRLGAIANPNEPAMYERALRHVLADGEARRNASAVATRHRVMAARSGQDFVDAVESVLPESR